MTDPSSRLRGRPTSTKPQLSDSNKNLVFDAKIDWPTDRLSQRDFDFDFDFKWIVSRRS
jgi:hypothetical protein